MRPHQLIHYKVFNWSRDIVQPVPLLVIMKIVHKTYMHAKNLQQIALIFVLTALHIFNFVSSKTALIFQTYLTCIRDKL